MNFLKKTMISRKRRNIVILNKGRGGQNHLEFFRKFFQIWFHTYKLTPPSPPDVYKFMLIKFDIVLAPPTPQE